MNSTKGTRALRNDCSAMVSFAKRCVVALACCAAVTAFAQAWKPVRSVEFIVGAAPGGSIDLTARLIQRAWEQQKVTATPVVVVNKPGAGQGIAWAYMNDKGARDGHAIAIGGPGLIANSLIGAHPLGAADITTIAILFDDYMAFVVRADSPLKSMRDVVERLRKDAGALSIGCAPGLGSGAHTGAVVAVKAAGASVKDVRFVAYKSAGEAITAAIAGEVDVVSGSVVNFPPHLQSGRIRAVGVTSPRRLAGTMGNVPTLKDSGIDAVYTNWRSVVGPNNMPREQVAYWAAAVEQAVKGEDWQKDLERNLWTANFLTGDAAKRYMEQQAEQFSAIYSDLGLGKN
jgi:putative tricarboxylic transport membrane protein